MKQKNSFGPGFLTGAALVLFILFILQAVGVLAGADRERKTLQASADAERFLEATEEKSRKSKLVVKAPPTKGLENAPIKMVEYADFHCGYCRSVHPTVQKLLEEYGAKIHYEFRHFPLAVRPGQGSFLVHEASVCAQEQGRFWEFHHAVFSATKRFGQEEIDRFVKDKRLNKEKFEDCLASGRYHDFIGEDRDLGSKNGISGTPTFFINSESVSGAYPYEHFQKIIEAELDPRKKEALQKEKENKKEQAEKPAKPVQFDDLSGKPSLGPENAPVTLVEFSDFHCPFCGRVTPTLEKLSELYPGKIRRVWMHFPLPFHAGAERTHAASECARDQGKFWEYHDKLFENIGKLRNDEALVNAAKEIGLDEKKMADCLSSEVHAAKVDADLAKGRSLGVTGTPAVFVNGRLISGAYPLAHFQAFVDHALDPTKPLPAGPKERKREPAKPKEPFQFDDLEGKPTLGESTAKVTIVEFSDLHCPYCKRVGPTLDKLMENYKGSLRRVWRHYPLPIHPAAPLAHQATECAREQGKFWEFKDGAFDQPRDERNLEGHVKLAESLGLNGSSMRDCLESKKYEGLIKADLAKGNEAGVRGTPAFFINGRFISGAHPYENFDKIIQEELKK